MASLSSIRPSLINDPKGLRAKTAKTAQTATPSFPAKGGSEENGLHLQRLAFVRGRRARRKKRGAFDKDGPMYRYMSPTQVPSDIELPTSITNQRFAPIKDSHQSPTHQSFKSASEPVNFVLLSNLEGLPSKATRGTFGKLEQKDTFVLSRGTSAPNVASRGAILLAKNQAPGSGPMSELSCIHSMSTTYLSRSQESNGPTVLHGVVYFGEGG